MQDERVKAIEAPWILETSISVSAPLLTALTQTDGLRTSKILLGLSQHPLALCALAIYTSLIEIRCQ